MRDRHLQIIAARGRMAWQKVAGYNWRALVEADSAASNGSSVTVCDPAPLDVGRPRVAIAVKAINRTLELGHPEYIRLP